MPLHITSDAQAAKHIDTVYALAAALLSAAQALDKCPSGLRPDIDALLDKPVYPGDLDHLAKTLESFADEWRGEIDAAEEADDRRRDNPLEPDFRRLGQ